MNDKIVAKLAEIISSKLDVNIDQTEIKPDSPLLEEGLGLDSIAVMEFITLIEEEFGFQFDEDELNLEPFETLNTLAAFVAEKQPVATVA